jgi:RES domain-containing protein
MEVYRISQEAFSANLSGNGAKAFGGRWNSVGIAALYAASSRSLALLETLAHTPAKMLQLKPYILIGLFIPDQVLPQVISINDLPTGWDDTDIHQFTTTLGDKFLLEKKKLLLSVPSVLMPEENIYVINPLHDDMKKVKIIHKRRIDFDRRVERHLE